MKKEEDRKEGERRNEVNENKEETEEEKKRENWINEGAKNKKKRG